jgi:O-acetyl-ADP-ribose deacetylase (regulator of RNase III)
VIHAVGPVYRDGNHGEADLLAGCYRTALKLAVDHACNSIAFPAISCGVYGYPIASAADIAIRETAAFLQQDDQIERAVFVLFNEPVYRVFCDVYRTVFDTEPESYP